MKPIIIGSDWVGHLVFFFLLVLLPIVSTYDAFASHSDSCVDKLIVGYSLFLIPQVWLHAQRVFLYDDEIVYRKFYFLKQRLKWNNIGRVELALKKFGQCGMDKYNGYYCMNFYLKNEKAIAMSINIKPFSRDGLAVMAHAIIRNAPNATMDNAIVALSKKSTNLITNEVVANMVRLFIFLTILFLILALFKALH